jgi:hypothetical protein
MAEFICVFLFFFDRCEQQVAGPGMLVRRLYYFSNAVSTCRPIDDVGNFRYGFYADLRR